MSKLTPSADTLAQTGPGSRKEEQIAWRSILVAAGYLAGLMLAGMIGAMLGAQMGASTGGASAFTWLFVSSILLGVILGPMASRLTLTRGQHFILWTSLIFFNMGSVAIEGAYFVPGLVTVPIPVLLAQQALASACAALVITLTFASIGRPRRFIASAASYLAFYYVFGAINYALVTKPYYEMHAGGLAAPAPEPVLMAELVRAPLIILSVLLFLLSTRGTRRQLMVRTGWLLFAVGGIFPLVLQISVLPILLLAASAVEIFCQNFLTGAVAARLMGIEENH
jgi:hypothetical protein